MNVGTAKVGPGSPDQMPLSGKGARLQSGGRPVLPILDDERDQLGERRLSKTRTITYAISVTTKKTSSIQAIPLSDPITVR